MTNSVSTSVLPMSRSCVETSAPDNPVEMITAVAVTPSYGSDAKATVPMIDEAVAEGHRPKAVAADTTYSSATNEASPRGKRGTTPARRAHNQAGVIQAVHSLRGRGLGKELESGGGFSVQWVGGRL